MFIAFIIVSLWVAPVVIHAIHESKKIFQFRSVALYDRHVFKDDTRRWRTHYGMVNLYQVRGTLVNTKIFHKGDCRICHPDRYFRHMSSDLSTGRRIHGAWGEWHSYIQTEMNKMFGIYEERNGEPGLRIHKPKNNNDGKSQ